MQCSKNLKKLSLGEQVQYDNRNYVYQETLNFYFLLPISRESNIFGSKIRNGDFDGFTLFKVS